ncbi:MAG: DUF1573 domain-containing protein [Ferruginibacter sp.]
MKKLKRILIVVILLNILISCRVGTFNKDEYISKDTVVTELKKLRETELTRIEIAPAIYFADTISKGDIIEGKFTIYNKGKVPFSIKKITNVCDCTVTKPDKDETMPGDSCNLSFKISTDNYSDGFNVRMITIMGNFHPYFRVLAVESYVGKKSKI